MSSQVISKDILFLLEPGFKDPQYPGERFYCWHCALIEGVISSFPELSKELVVKRIAWERPRNEVIELVGEENQSLPLLILAPDGPSQFSTGRSGEVSFIADKDQILEALSARHGFPRPHP